MKKYFLILLVSSFIFGQGPENIATVDRNLWTKPMNNSKDFDVASKMEMLVFVNVLSEIETQKLSDIFNTLNVKEPNIKSVNTWKTKTKKQILKNCTILEKSALSEIVSLQNISSYENISLEAKKLEKDIPTELKPWYKQSKKFYTTYILECLRLAAKNPKRTSEIELIDNSEKNGFEQKDKSFLLTFDDGPTLSSDGNTDEVIKMLKNNQLSGIFFLSGDRLQQRVNKEGKEKLVMLYGTNAIGSHSMIHQSHQYLKTWKNQVDEASQLIRATFGLNNQKMYFRAPYGQRTLEMTKYLNQDKQPILLWNIDSQDWNNKISSKEVSSRVIALMLLWRKGIILFHDVHPKAKNAVPEINQYFEKANIKWLQPKEIQ